MKGINLRPRHLKRNAVLIGANGWTIITGKIVKNKLDVGNRINQHAYNTKYAIAGIGVRNSDSIELI